MNSAPNSLLAQKGKARPAMRRQNQPSNRGFGDSGGLGGFLMGGETEDLGWNDMGDAPAPTETPRAIGLTPFSGSPESLYVEGSDVGDPDWDEADSYDDDGGFGTGSAPIQPDAKAQWRESGKQPPNPVGAMQEKLQAATGAATPVAAPEPVVITKEVIKEVIKTVEVPAAAPVNIFDRMATAISRFFAAFTGRADRLLVLRLDRNDVDRLTAAADAEGRDEDEIVAAAIENYLTKSHKSQA